MEFQLYKFGNLCKKAPNFWKCNPVQKMNNSSEDESAFSAITRIPIAPFSAFLNGTLL